MPDGDTGSAITGTAAATESARAEPPPLSSSGASRFSPGSVLADRYRIVSLLGSGGMGEVYRAEDLRLGQTVALKFVSHALAGDPAARQRLYQEVRLGRQVAHPNVCRLYDVVEWSGHLFVTMEYIDGEDLASLLRRIGALPAPKILALTREICAGLAAAHGLGIVHRDLKPANVMIDGRGRARITDFGLAVLTEDAVERRATAGTPAYMAPEQLRGEPASVASDLYALGLLLFEMLTGRRLYHAATVPEMLRQHERSGKGAALATSAPGASPLRRIVERCLEERPEDRPRSIHAVIADLPGSDPLQAAVDAGETPSPDTVAAAEGSGELRPGVAVGTLVLLLVLLLLHAWTKDRYGQGQMLAESERPEVLAARAADLLGQIGVDVQQADTAYHIRLDRGRRQWLAQHRSGWNDGGRRLVPSRMFLWYRAGPPDKPPLGIQQQVTQSDPPLDTPGMARVELDARGRLTGLAVVAPDRLAEGPLSWTALLAATGLQQASLREVAPQWRPDVGSTSRRAWVGTYPGQADVPMRVEVAAAGGRPVWLRVIAPWTPAGERPPQAVWQRLSDLGQGLLIFVALGVGTALARRHLLRGRGDRRGAFRLAVFIAISSIGELLGRADFVRGALLDQVIQILRVVTYRAFFGWLLYLAVEPYLRRVWPRLMIGWHRLVGGRWQDARVGRELLLGLLGGCTLSLVLVAAAITADPEPYRLGIALLGRLRDVVAQAVGLMAWSGWAALLYALLLLVLTIVARRRGLALAALWLILALVAFSGSSNLGLVVFAKMVGATIMVGLLARVGLLALASFLYAFALLSFPLTLDPTRWYFVHSLVPLLALAGLAGWAAWRAVGERRLLETWLAEEALPR